MKEIRHRKNDRGKEKKKKESSGGRQYFETIDRVDIHTDDLFYMGKARNGRKGAFFSWFCEDVKRAPCRRKSRMLDNAGKGQVEAFDRDAMILTLEGRGRRVNVASRYRIREKNIKTKEDEVTHLSSFGDNNHSRCRSVVAKVEADDQSPPKLRHLRRKRPCSLLED